MWRRKKRWATCRFFPSGEAHVPATVERPKSSFTCRRYLGEWFDTSEPDFAPYTEQREKAMNMCWTVAGVYGGFAVASALGMCYYSFKAKRA